MVCGRVFGKISLVFVFGIKETHLLVMFLLKSFLQLHLKLHFVCHSFK